MPGFLPERKPSHGESPAVKAAVAIMPLADAHSFEDFIRVHKHCFAMEVAAEGNEHKLACMLCSMSMLYLTACMQFPEMRTQILEFKDAFIYPLCVKLQFSKLRTPANVVFAYNWDAPSVPSKKPLHVAELSSLVDERPGNLRLLMNPFTEPDTRKAFENFVLLHVRIEDLASRIFTFWAQPWVRGLLFLLGRPRTNRLLAYLFDARLKEMKNVLGQIQLLFRLLGDEDERNPYRIDKKAWPHIVKLLAGDNEYCSITGMQNAWVGAFEKMLGVPRSELPVFRDQAIDAQHCLLPTQHALLQALPALQHYLPSHLVAELVRQYMFIKQAHKARATSFIRPLPKATGEGTSLLMRLACFFRLCLPVTQQTYQPSAGRRGQFSSPGAGCPYMQPTTAVASVDDVIETFKHRNREIHDYRYSLLAKGHVTSDGEGSEGYKGV